jgi:hypothetical protein
VATFGGSLGLDGAGDRWVPGARGLIASSKIHPFLDVPDQAVVSQRRKTPSFHPLLSHKEGSGAERGGTRLDLWRSGGSLADLASDGDSLLVACARVFGELFSGVQGSRLRLGACCTTKPHSANARLEAWVCAGP